MPLMENCVKRMISAFHAAVDIGTKQSKEVAAERVARIAGAGGSTQYSRSV